MNDNSAVKFSHVSKIYKLKKGNHKAGEQFYALKALSFEVEKGDVVGVLGSNGSGKSTMSLLLAGISLQDEGTIEVNGEQALIAINTGLNDQLSGYENIYYKGALLGFKKKQIRDMVKDVVEFAEIGDFMDQPVVLRQLNGVVALDTLHYGIGEGVVSLRTQGAGQNQQG